MRKLDHPNIVKLLEVIPISPKVTCIVMEYCSGGELFEVVQKGGAMSEERKSFPSLMN